MPLSRRLPKRGFRGRPKKLKPRIFNLGEIQRLYDQGRLAWRGDIAALDLLSGRAGEAGPVKLLAKGVLRAPLHIWVHMASEMAIRKVEAAGGSVSLEGAPADERDAMKLTGSLNRDSAGHLRVDMTVGMDKEEYSVVQASDLKVVIRTRNAEFEKDTILLSDVEFRPSMSKRSKRGVFSARVFGKQSKRKPTVSLFLLYKNRLVKTAELAVQSNPSVPLKSA